MTTEQCPQLHPTGPKPLSFRGAFENPEYEVEVEYIGKDRVEYAELHPSEVPDLRDKVQFRIVAAAHGRHQIWQHDTRKGLYRVGETTTFGAAKTVVDLLASHWTERTDILDEAQLRKHIFEHHVISNACFESLDDVISALQVEEHERDQYCSCWLWAVLKTESGWALWATDDVNSDVVLKGQFETEAAAEEAAGTLSSREFLDIQEWLMSEAYGNWKAAEQAGDPEAETFRDAYGYLRSSLDPFWPDDDR